MYITHQHKKNLLNRSVNNKIKESKYSTQRYEIVAKRDANKDVDFNLTYF